MKLVTICQHLPNYTQVSVLYSLLGSLNSSAINSATRKVAQDLKDLNAAQRTATNVISIDRYNELLNELRERQVGVHMAEEQGFAYAEDTADGDPTAEGRKEDFLDLILTVRAPLVAMLNATQAKLPKGDRDPADFSFEETLARQLAREFSVQAMADAALEQGLIDSGACTKEELEAVDRERFETDRAFKDEFKFLILDKLNDREMLSATIEDADEAFSKLNFDYQTRLLAKMLPKLQKAKSDQLGRRSSDPDAYTNITILGLAINEIKKYIGDSDADAKLAAMQKALAA